jgi:beta-glucosidase/6-phospho-beta-glucosidase/beta-galactosidase
MQPNPEDDANMNGTELYSQYVRKIWTKLNNCIQVWVILNNLNSQCNVHLIKSK